MALDPRGLDALSNTGAAPAIFYPRRLSSMLPKAQSKPRQRPQGPA